MKIKLLIILKLTSPEIDWVIKSINKGLSGTNFVVLIANIFSFRLCGGVGRNNLLLKLICALTNCKIERMRESEMSLTGTMYLAGLGAGKTCCHYHFFSFSYMLIFHGYFMGNVFSWHPLYTAKDLAIRVRLLFCASLSIFSFFLWEVLKICNLGKS